MNKKLLFIFLISFILIIPINVNALTVSVSDFSTLKYILNNGTASSGGQTVTVDEIKLTGNIDATNNIIIHPEIAIDLNGYTLDMKSYTLVTENIFTVKDTSDNKLGKITGSTLTFKTGQTNKGTLKLESGTIEGTGTYAINNTGNVIVNGGTIYTPTGRPIYGNVDSTIVQNGGIIKTDGTNKDAILLSKTGASFEMNGGTVEALGTNSVAIAAFKYTTVVINNGTVTGYSSALMGNGSISGDNEGTEAKFTINGGILSAPNGIGIYAPQPNGETIINGGTISGKNGIELRAGNLKVTGGTINSTVNEYVVIPNNSGSTSEGSAIAVVQHNTKLPINVHICGGTLNGAIPFTEANSQHNEQEYLDLITLKIDSSCGSLVMNSKDTTQTVYSEDFTNFISGGLYTNDVSRYIVSEYSDLQNNDGMWEVNKFYDINIEEPTTGNVTTSIRKSASNREVEIITEVADGYELVSIEVYDENNNRIEVINNRFIMPDGNVTIKTNIVKKRVMGANEENPDTKDNVLIYIIISILSIVGIINTKKVLDR